MTLPIELCCRPGKEKDTKRTDEPEAQPINEGGDQIDVDQHLTRQKTHEAESVESAPDRTSLISDPDSDGDDELNIPDLTAD